MTLLRPSLRKSDLAETVFRLREELRETPSPEIGWIDSLKLPPDREQTLRLLFLRSALDHGLGVCRLDSLCTALWEECGESLWTLPPPRTAALRKVLSSLPELDGWILRERFAGIVWSVGKMIRRSGTLETALKRPPEEFLSEAAETVFWYGRRSPERLKGRRFLMTAHLPEPWGGGLFRPAEEWKNWRLPVWRGSMLLWSDYRSLLAEEGEQLSRIDVADRLTRLAFRLDPSAPLTVGYLFRQYRRTSP